MIELPLLSVAVQVTRVVPGGNCAGALFVIVTDPPEHEPVAVAMPMSIEPQAVVVMSGGTKVNASSSASETVTTAVHVSPQ